MGPSGQRFYHDISLRGPVPDRLLIRLPALRGPDEAVAQRLAEIAKAQAPAFFDKDAPGFAYAHSFAWLAPLSHREGGRHVAGALFDAWSAEHGRYAPKAWAPLHTARRTEAMLTYAPLLLEGRDGPHREQVFGTLIRQTRHLAKAVKRGPSADTRVAVAAGLMLGAMALPGAGDHERTGKPAIERALAAMTAGELPASLRRPGEAQALASTLLALRAAYKERGLSAPDALGGALTVLRLYLGALALPEGNALAVLPCGIQGDERLLDALRLARRPEGCALLSRFGYELLGRAKTRVHVDTRGGAAGAFTLSDGGARIVTASGAPGPGLRATQSRMRDWADALSLPAASATLDAPGFGEAHAVTESSSEGEIVTLRREHTSGLHERRLFLSSGGDAVIGEDETPAPDAVYRFPLHPDAEIRTQEEDRVSVILATGRIWRFETAHAAVAIEDGVYSGGGVPFPIKQIVLTARKPGVRWAWRRS